MSRNFYILAATLSLFAVISGVMSMLPSNLQPGLPANGSLWKTLSMFLLLIALVSMLIGSMSHLFEQVDRRTEERGHQRDEQQDQGQRLPQRGVGGQAWLEGRWDEGHAARGQG